MTNRNRCLLALRTRVGIGPVWRFGLGRGIQRAGMQLQKAPLSDSRPNPN
jgi:hypothetical protein